MAASLQEAQEGGRVSIADIDTAIQAAEREFAFLNSGRWRRVYLRSQHRTVLRYRSRDAVREAGIGAAAERIARLMRFRSQIFAKQYALDSRD